MKIDQNCYLIAYEKDNDLTIGSAYIGETIVSLELCYNQNEKYIKITTYPIDYDI